MVVRPPGPHQTAVQRNGGATMVGNHSLPEVLLPLGGHFAPAPASAPHRALALDALQLRRGLRDARRRPVRWAESSFAREVELIRCHLAPLHNRRSLAASFGREAFQTLEADQLQTVPLGPIRAAYAIRWLELGGGASLPVWARLLTVGRD